MSIDFDSAALQTQHDEEEYDQEDYAREQELQKLLTDLPDDMLEDSRDSSLELECSTCSNKNSGSRSHSKWKPEWSDHAGPSSHMQTYEVDYGEGSHDEYEAAHMNGHLLAHTWNQDHQFAQQSYPCSSTGSEKCTKSSDYSAEFEERPYPESTENHVNYVVQEDCSTRNQFQNLNSGLNDKGANQYQVSYNPHLPVHQQKVFNSQTAPQGGQFDHLQREFLDSTQQNADRERLAQLQILNKAQQRQIEDLERKLEDSRRNMRYLEHQFAIVKDEKDGVMVSFKESSRLIEEAKEREVQMQNKLKAVEQQVQILQEKDQENMKKQRVADAAVDSMKQQMLELRRSDTLSKAREQHDRDLAVMKEQHEDALLALHQKLDSTSQGLSEQIEVGQKLREQVKLLERQREEEQLERAKIVNSLSQRLEESQQQCAKLLQTNSVQEVSQLQIKLQQAQSAKALSENLNKVLQEDLADLKEQITLYESAVKHGVVTLDLNTDWENHLSESCVDLGFKNANRKNGTLHSSALAHLPESSLPKDEALRLMQVEMQRCLGCLKGKRQKISQLQAELQLCQTRVHELQTELEEAKLSSSVKEASQMEMAGDPQKELKKLQEGNRHLQEQVELLEEKHKELKQNEEKLKSANSELCNKMREMIQELDQEKQEAAERSERIHQQYRDDVVNRVRSELVLEHNALVEQLTAQHQQQIQQLQNQLSEVNDKMLAVQECYISVCKEKSLLEETIQNREKEETELAVEKLRRELEAQHQASITHLKAVWSKEKETEIQQQVNSHVASTEARWKHELQKREKTWVQKLEDAKKERNKETAEVVCQTDELEVKGQAVFCEELDSRLKAQKKQLQLEADKVQRKAVEGARKQLQRELEEKHLEDMAKQVEGALTRAYNHWTEDLSSLPEYQASLQTEKEKWEELQKKITRQKVSQALSEAEEQISGALRVKELQEELVALKSQLEQVNREQAALLKAELAGAKAAWNRDKQQEISTIQVRSEQAYQTKLQEQRKKLEQAVKQAREDANLQRKELLLQMEAKFQQAVRAREEEWRRQLAEKELTQKQQIRDEFITELQNGLAEVRTQLVRSNKPDDLETSGSTPEVTLMHVIRTSCREMVNRAISEAKREWNKMSEEKLSHVLKQIQEQHLREISKLQSCSSQRKEQSRCRKECTETLSKLQKKNQELQRHLEKACRQLQHSVREHKTTVQHLKDQHDSSLQKLKQEHLNQLEEVKSDRKPSGCDHQQNLQEGLEEMKQQYLKTVEKIRGDMLRYLQESRERAAEMIRIEVQRERQDTARKMRRYYLSCLQELLEDGGKTTGAETKIMNAASKLAAMAKVLETPVKSKSGKSYSLPSCSMAASAASTGTVPGRNPGFNKNLSALTEAPDIRPEERSHREKTSADSGQKSAAAVRNKLLSHQNSPGGSPGSLEDNRPQTSYTNSHQARHQVDSQSHVDFVRLSVRGKSLEWHLHEGDSNKGNSHLESGRPSKASLVQETPVREEKRTDWSTTSCDSDKVSRLMYLGRKVEPVRPFSVSANEICEFGGFSPDVPDLTVYQEIPRKTENTESSDRRLIPGSECESEQRLCSRPQFSELRLRQQDSGFDSPFCQHE